MVRFLPENVSDRLLKTQIVTTLKSPDSGLFTRELISQIKAQSGSRRF